MERSVVRSRWDARSIRRSWMKRMGEVPRVRWTVRCSIRSLTPMALAAWGMLIGSARRSRAPAFEGRDGGVALGQGAGDGVDRLRGTFVDHEVARYQVGHGGAGGAYDRQGQVDVSEGRACGGDAVGVDDHLAFVEVDGGVAVAEGR
jgi:hypothetical protein